MAGNGTPLETIDLFQRSVRRAGTRDSCYWESLLARMRRSRDELEELLGEHQGEGEWQERLKKGLEGACPPRRDKLLELQETLLDLEAVLIEGHLRLVLHVTRRYFEAGIGSMEEMDILQEGCRGLLTAARRHDLRGYPGFSTYAVFIIRRFIIDEVSRQSKLVRIPRQMLRRGVKAKSLIDSFVAANGRLPTLSEMNSRFDLKMDWILAMSLLDMQHVSLDAREESDQGLSPLPGCSRGQPHLDVAEELELARIARVLDGLPERSRVVLVLRLGLLEGRIEPLRRVSEIVGVSMERVRQIEKEALAWLRTHLCPDDS